jgi:hypothetical protein
LHIVRPLPARDPDEYSFLMTSDLSLGAVCWSLQLRGSHMDSLPYIYNDNHVPSTLPNNTPHAALAIPYIVSSSTLAERPLAASTDHVHRLPPPRINTPAGNCSPSRTARSLWRLIHRVPASQRTHRVCVSASRMHQHRRMWVAARRTRCRSRGVRAEREGGVMRELAVLRVAGRHAQRGHRHTACSQGSVRAPPAAPSFLARPCRKRGRTPRADASLCAAIHFARVKGRATCIYTAQQLTRAAHQP